MYIGCVMLQLGFQVSRPSVGPDLCVHMGDMRIWIEATAPERGCPKSPDYVPELPEGKGGRVPVEQIVLRLTGAIHTKLLKFSHYRERGIVSDHDVCVLALSGAKLRHPVDLAYIERAVYEAGDLYVVLDQASHEMVQHGRRHEPMARKHDSNAFRKPSFIDGSCSQIAGLLFGWRGIANTPRRRGSELAFFTIATPAVSLHRAGSVWDRNIGPKSNATISSLNHLHIQAELCTSEETAGRCALSFPPRENSGSARFLTINP
jgi:hypothetical protein